MTTIPHYPDEEISLCSDQLLSESDQEVLAGYLLSWASDGTVKQTEHMVSTWGEQDVWNYHDDSWTEYTKTCAFRITKEIFEKNRDHSEEPSIIWPFRDIIREAEECFGTRHYEKGSLTDNRGRSTDLWWEVYNIYVRDIKGIPGYIHLVHAVGSDRNC